MSFSDHRVPNGFVGQYFPLPVSMNFEFAPCGPCGTVAEVCSSFPWQSEQYMVWVPTELHCAVIWLLLSDLGTIAPERLFAETVTGCPELFSVLNSIAWSVRFVPDGPMRVVTPFGANPRE